MVIDTIYKMIIKEIVFNPTECKIYKIKPTYLVRRTLGKSNIKSFDNLEDYEILDSFGNSVTKKEEKKVKKAIKDIVNQGGMEEKYSFLEVRK